MQSVIASKVYTSHCALRNGVAFRHTIRSRFVGKKQLPSHKYREEKFGLHRRFPKCEGLGGNGNGDPITMDVKIHCNLDAFPDCQFFNVEAVIRPWRLNSLVSRLSNEGIKGMTTTRVQGVGVQGGLNERYKGAEFGDDDLVEKAKLSVVCARSQVDEIATIIVDAVRTGEIGDGKIFIYPVADVVRIRTGERGAAAEHMRGGRTDIRASIDETL